MGGLFPSARRLERRACVLALPLLRKRLLSDRTSVRLPTWWLAFGQVGLESASHPLGKFDMFQEVSPLFSRPEFSSARAAIGWALPSRRTCLSLDCGNCCPEKGASSKNSHTQNLPVLVQW